MMSERDVRLLQLLTQLLVLAEDAALNQVVFDCRKAQRGRRSRASSQHLLLAPISTKLGASPARSAATEHRDKTMAQRIKSRAQIVKQLPRQCASVRVC